MILFSGVIPPRAHSERSVAQHLSGEHGGLQPVERHPGKAGILVSNMRAAGARGERVSLRAALVEAGISLAGDSHSPRNNAGLLPRAGRQGSDESVALENGSGYRGRQRLLLPCLASSTIGGGVVALAFITSLALVLAFNLVRVFAE